MDVALHRAGVTLVLDRAGVTGDDGPSHNGMWDLALLRNIPRLHLAAPRDAQRLKEALGKCLTIDDAPSAIRFPKGAVGADIAGESLVGNAQLVFGNRESPIVILAVGAMVQTAIDAAKALGESGIEVAVVDPIWCYPVSEELVGALATHDIVVTVEDGLASGGVGSAYAQAISELDSSTKVRVLGLDSEFIHVAKRNRILSAQGLDANGISNAIANLL
jgi:1-deoxy-D-xylulose-5-phosphate synthase